MLTIPAGWLHIFDRVWPMHSSVVSEVASHIERLARLMRTDIRLEHIQQEYEFRKDALEGFKKQAKENRQQEFYRIKTSLNLRGYNEALNRIHGLRCREAGAWLFSNETYTKWFDGFPGESRILWLKGIPGAGKKTFPLFPISALFPDLWTGASKGPLPVVQI